MTGLNRCSFIFRFVELKIRIPVKNIRVVHSERAECSLFTVTVGEPPQQTPLPIHINPSLYLPESDYI